jgi:hypothetical protein
VIPVPCESTHGVLHSMRGACVCARTRGRVRTVGWWNSR